MSELFNRQDMNNKELAKAVKKADEVLVPFLGTYIRVTKAEVLRTIEPYFAQVYDTVFVNNTLYIDGGAK